jgi:hypothetical protein
LVSQATVQLVPLQPTVPPPPMIAGHAVQELPHESTELLLRHIGLPAVPQLWAPVSHWMLHTPVVEHAGCESEPVGWLAQGAQVSPHWVTLWATQVPPQMCWFAPHDVSQTPAELHAEPVGQGEQSTVSSVPQKLLSEFSTQAPPHRWRLAGQSGTQAVPLQVMVPLVGAAGQTVQLFPHDVMLVLLLTTQVALAPDPQAW